MWQEKFIFHHPPPGKTQKKEIEKRIEGDKAWYVREHLRLGSVGNP